jgi:hypothetical protein
MSRCEGLGLGERRRSDERADSASKPRAGKPRSVAGSRFGRLEPRSPSGLPTKSAGLLRLRSLLARGLLAVRLAPSFK